MVVICVLFFFKQKTAYEMRISDWSSDVCSSDLPDLAIERPVAQEADGRFALQDELAIGLKDRRTETVEAAALAQHADPAHFDEGLLAANFEVEIAEIPAPEIFRFVVNEARIIAREFVGVPGHAELLPQLRVALENEPAQDRKSPRLN